MSTSGWNGVWRGHSVHQTIEPPSRFPQCPPLRPAALHPQGPHLTIMESTAGARLQDGARALFWTRPWYALGHRLTPAKRLYMNENAVRARAGLLHVTGWTVLLLALLYSDSVFLQKTIAPVVLWDFVAAAAVGLTPLSPFGVAGTALTWAQPPVWTPAGPKRFAWSIGALLVAACVALAVLRLKAAALATVVACMLFTWLEAALGFCLGCWVWNVVAPALGLGEPCHACEGGVCPMPPAPPAGRARAVAPPPLPPTPAPRTPPSTPPTSGAGACQDMGAANSPTGSSNGEPGPHLCGPRVVTVVVADGSPQHPPLDCGLPVSAMDSAAEEEGDPLEALGQPPETPVPPAAPPGVPYGGGLEEYFAKYRRHIVGHEHPMQTRSGQTVALLYADWTASGRLYHPIERFLTHDVGPMVGNPHTEASLVGAQMTRAYESARAVVRRHVNAGPEDVVLFVGSGMTGALSKLLDFTGLRVARARPKRRAVRQCRRAVHTRARPVVFISHFEHHSNQLPWQELDVDVRIVDRGADGRPDLGHLGRLLRRYRHRTTKIGAFSACSNVTGIRSDCHALAAAMHRHGGVCVVDFACSAPYVAIDMRPADPSGRLDAIVFSAHKFLGGPGGTGVLVCAPGLYAAPRPTMPGGGTVAFSNPWGDVVYHSGIEAREDAGTPPYLQVWGGGGRGFA